MSLWSILNSQSSSTGATYGTAKATAAMQQIIAKQKEAATAQTSSAQTDTPVISANAQLAAAEKADNAKDFNVLTTQMRTALDTQHKAHSGNEHLDLTEFSARALASVALNHDGKFALAEVTQAKAELRTRSIEAYRTTVSGKSGIAALTAYNNWLVARYDAASPEERTAMGWTDQTREGAEKFLNRDTSFSSDS